MLPYDSFTSIADATGQITFEVPSAWRDRRENGWFTSMPGIPDGVPMGPGVNAAVNVADWGDDLRTPGVFIGSSSIVAEHYDAAGLSSVFSHTGCEIGQQDDYQRPPLRGTSVTWHCEGTDAQWHHLAAAPDDEDYIVFVQAKTVSARDADALDRILASLDVTGANCDVTPQGCE